jgi:hypothetical protein
MVRQLNGKLVCAITLSQGIRIFDITRRFELVYETANASSFLDYDNTADIVLVPINIYKRIEVLSKNNFSVCLSIDL